MTLIPLRLATDGFFTSVGQNSLNQATLDAIQNSVWSAVLAQYQTAGTAGAKLNSTSTLTVNDIPAGLNAAQVWGYAGGSRSLSGAQSVSLADIEALIRALVLGGFEIDYDLSTATQRNPNGTVRQVFDLKDKFNSPATNGASAVKRVPQ